MAQRQDGLLDVVRLRRAAEQQPGRERADDRRRTGLVRAPCQSESQQQGQRRQHARNGLAVQPADQRWNDETADHEHGDEEAECLGRDQGYHPGGHTRSFFLNHAADDGEHDQAENVVDHRRAEDDLALGLVQSAQIVQHATFVIPTIVAVNATLHRPRCIPLLL